MTLNENVRDGSNIISIFPYPSKIRQIGGMFYYFLWVAIQQPYVLELLTSDFYENISTKSYTHAEHLHNIYKEYTELHTENENENEN